MPLDKFSNHQPGMDAIIQPGELMPGPYGRHVIKQLLESACHIQDKLSPKELLEHFCREEQPGQKTGKEVACPNLSVFLSIGRNLVVRGPCRECLQRFVQNLEDVPEPEKNE